jgi:hypothetical protein
MEITITRDENGLYVIKDYQGRSITESRETLLKMLGFALDRQDKLIADFKGNPSEFTVNPITQHSLSKSTYMGQPVSEMSQEKLIKALEEMSKAYHRSLTGQINLQG